MCIAKALVKDGYTEASVVALASMSREMDLASLDKASNAARAMDRITTRAVPLLQDIYFYVFNVQLESRRSSGIDFIMQYMLLPHELFSVLYHHHWSKFSSVFTTQDCDSFWSKQPPARLKACPLYSKRDRVGLYRFDLLVMTRLSAPRWHA